MKLRALCLGLAVGAFCVGVTGCSGALGRHEATHQIRLMLKPHHLGSSKQMVEGGVPGFELPETEVSPTAYFTLDKHKGYDAPKEDESPSGDTYLFQALSEMGYVTFKEEGPTTEMSVGNKLKYDQSRTVQITNKLGTYKDTGYSKEYSSGFSCYPPPNFDQCDLPPLIIQDAGFKITGIKQDESRAVVNILLPWKLTRFGMDLKPYAAAIETNESKLGSNSSYYQYEALYNWEHFLNEHSQSGVSPAAILFQKFDDGWRIVDKDGKSEKDVVVSK